MEFTKFDLTLLISLALFVTLASLTFPAMGLVADDVNTTDIPQFNITNERFNWAGDFPEQVEAPSQGTLVYNSTIPLNGFGDESHVWLEGSESSGGIRLSLTESGSTFAENAEFRLEDFSTTPVTAETVEIQNVSEGDILANFSYRIEVQWTQNETFVQDGQTEAEFTGTYEITQRPSDEGWLSSIPLVGGVVSGVWQTVAYIGIIFWWVSTTALQIILNLIGVVYDIVTFMLTGVYFIVNNYTAIIDGAPFSWIKLILTIPLFGLGYVLAKIAIIMLQLLPTT